MEIVDFLQLVLLLSLLVAVAILQNSLRAARRFDDRPDIEKVSEKNPSCLAHNRTFRRSRNDLNRQLDRRLASG